MQALKRISIFLIVNVFILATISIVLSLLGLESYLTPYGINYESLMIFCLIWGMGGAFISLMLSRIMAKWMMGVKIIPVDTRDPDQSDLVRQVHHLARGAGLTTMPQVGIYNSPEVNAFATGPTRNRALVAVSTGLLRRMDNNAVNGVLGHEMAHIVNGDMVTMTLVQGVINAFVMFIARVLAFAVSAALSGGRERGGHGSWMMQFMLTMVFQIVLSFLGMIVVAWFSRWREFRADAGGARLAGKQNMIGALKALQSYAGIRDESHDARSLATMKISGKSRGLMALFATHPPLPERIRRLERGM